MKIVDAMLETLVKDFFEFIKIKFYFTKILRKFDIIIIICKGLLLTAIWDPVGKG